MRKPILWSALIGLIALFALSACTEPEAPRAEGPEQENWIQLFNGENLDGWDLKIRGYPLNENFGNTFRVEDGLLEVRTDAYDPFDERFGHIFYNQPFSHYRIAVEYRFVGEQAAGGPGWALRNSGIMVHSQSAASMGLEQDFPISIEVQLLGGTGEGERSTANLCTPGTHVVMADTLTTQHCIESGSPTFHGDAWVRVEVTVLGDSLITHTVEGQQLMAYTKPQIGGEVVSGFDPAMKPDGQPLTEGYIALQSESHPVDFRKVELLNLSGCMNPEDPNYRSYFVHADPDACAG